MLECNALKIQDYKSHLSIKFIIKLPQNTNERNAALRIVYVKKKKRQAIQH